MPQDPASLWKPVQAVPADPSSLWKPVPNQPQGKPAYPVRTSITGQIQNGVDKLSHVESADARPGLMGHIETALGNAGAGLIGSTAGLLAHPLQTLEAPLKVMSTPYTGRVDPGLLSAAEDVREKPGGYAEALPGMIAGGKMTEGIIRAPRVLRDYLRPSPSPEIVSPAEMASRKLAQAVIPPTRNATPFISAAPKEVPNIIRYAKETNNPLKTQLEFAKAAEGHAGNVRNFYENQILRPNDRVVSVAGTGYEGPTLGEGQSAKLSDIDKRIVQINKELSGAHAKLNAGDVRSSLASKTALQAELGKLTDILHRELGHSTGLKPEEVANVRQRVGRSYELANDTNAGVTARMQGEGRTAQEPFHVSQIPSKIIEFIQGGPQAIADRQFMRSIKKFPGEAEPLPTIRPTQAASSQRAPIWAGLEPEDRAAPTLTGDVENARKLMEARLAPRRAAVAAREAEREINRSSHGGRARAIWAGLEPEDRAAPTLTGDVENARKLMEARLAPRRAAVAAREAEREINRSSHGGRARGDATGIY